MLMSVVDPCHVRPPSPSANLEHIERTLALGVHDHPTLEPFSASVEDKLAECQLRLNDCTEKGLSNQEMYVLECELLGAPVSNALLQHLSAEKGVYEMEQLSLKGYGLVTIVHLLLVIMANQKLKYVGEEE